MAGSSANWFRPTSGPLAGQAVYISKNNKTQGGATPAPSRAQIQAGLNSAQPTFLTMARLSAPPSGVALKAVPPPPAPAPKAGPSKLAPSGQASIAQNAGGSVYQAPNGQFGLYNSKGNLLKSYKTQGGATRALGKLAPQAASQTTASAQTTAQQASGAGLPGKGKRDITASLHPASTSIPEFHVKTYTSAGARDRSIAQQQAQGSARNLSSAEKTAIANYQDGLGWSLETLPPSQAGTGQGVYQAVNRKLRNQPEPDYEWNSPSGRQAVDRIIRDLDSAMTKSTVPEDTVAFRGIRSGGDRNGVFNAGYQAFKSQVYDQWEVGKTYGPSSGLTDKAYTSTTLDRKIADRIFTRGNQAGIMLEYRIPEGTRGVSMNATNPNSGFSKTAEILLDKNLSYKVVGKYSDSSTGQLHAVLEIVP